MGAIGSAHQCTFTTISKSSSVIFENDLSRKMPALLINTSTRPSVHGIVYHALRTSSTDTEPPFAMASPPMALISATTASAASEEPPLPPAPQIVDDDFGLGEPAQGHDNDPIRHPLRDNGNLIGK